MFPLASNASLVEYLQEPAEIPDFSALSSHRKILWEKLHPYRMKVICLSPAQFIHFGTTKELLLLMTRDIAKYTHLDWSANITGNTNDPSYSVHNAFVTDGAHIGSGSYLEHSIIGQNVTVGSGSILSYVMVTNTIVPENVVLHGFELQDGRFVVRIYGIDDNPKESVDHPASFLGTTLQQFMQENGLSAADLWADHESHSLWDARLYPVCDTIDEAVHAALNVYAMTCGKGDVNTWRVATRESLASSYPKADIGAILDFQAQITRTVQVENFLQLISQNGTLQEAHDLLNHNMLDEKQIVLLRERANASSWSQKMRIYYYMGRLSCGTQSETFLNHSFDVLRQGVFSGSAHHPAERIDFHIATPDVDIRLPLRVNWGGGWSDTPPICHEHGGTVLNVAIFLNGNLPVQGELHQLDAKHVILESTDTGAHGIFTDLSDLQDCHNPYDPFALHKAALIACGVIPRQGGNLSALLHRLGGGFSLSTQVLGVPKGSGLGTSSILASACVKGIFAFMGQPCSDEAIFDIVLCMEQLMSTGGGWQDQVGGVIPGIKYIHTLLSMQQSMRVCKVEVPAPAMQELGNRFALIYTGQRRMARNLLREIVGHYLAADPTTLAVLEDIQKTAALMRFELERGRIDAFASLINRHWELSKALDKGSTNTCIDQIFLLIDDLIDGRMICGAGGGGFLQVILKKNATHQQLRERLRSMFHDTPVDVWDCAFV